MAFLTISRASASAIRLLRREARPDRRDPARRDRREQHARRSSPLVSASMPTSSSTCRGASGSSSSTTTPHNGEINGAKPSTAGVHGPAATATAPAGWWTPSTVTPVARPFSTCAYASTPTRSVAPASWARSANALRRRGGRDGAAGLQPPGGQAVGERGLGGAQLGALQQRRVAAPGTRRGSGARLVGDEQQADVVRGQREPAPERPVVLDRLLVEVDERRVERVLDDARVAPGRARGDRLALVEHDARARLGQERRQRAADDAAADDREVRARRSHRAACSAAASSSGVFTLATSAGPTSRRGGARRASVRRSPASSASASRSTGSCAGS